MTEDRPTYGPIADYHDREAWLTERRSGLGSSDIAAIFGLHPFKTAHEVWLDKVGMAPPVEETPDMRRGKRLEPVAAELFEEVTGLKVRRQPLKRHRAHPWLLASVDRQILSSGDRPTGPLEIKVPRSSTFGRWRRQGLPDYVVLQGQLEAGVWSAGLSTFAIYNPDGDELLTPVVPASEVVWKQIVERSGEWWDAHIIKGVEPENVKLEIEALPKVDGALPFYRTEDATFARCAEDFFEARDLVAEAKAVQDAAKAALLAAMGDSWGIYENDAGRFYYQMKDGRRTFQVKDLEKFGAIDPTRIHAIATRWAHPFPLTAEYIDELVEELKANATLDLAPFWKQGNPYPELRGFRLRGSE